MFGANAGSVYASQYPGVEAGQAMQAQTGGIQAGLQQEEANNTLNVGNYNASMQTLQDEQTLGNTAESFNAGGVLMQGSPLGVLEQQRQVAAAGVNQMQQQTGLQAQMQNTQANQTINATRSQLLGMSNQFTSGLANADIEQEDVPDKDLGALFGGIGEATSVGASVAQIAANL
jgi:hypothetical protein